MNTKFLLVTIAIISILSCLTWGFGLLIQSGPYHPISYPIPPSVLLAVGTFGLVCYAVRRVGLL